MKRLITLLRNDERLRDWAVRTVHQDERQLYGIGDWVDAQRQISFCDVQLTIWVQTGADTVGSAGCMVDMEGDLTKQITDLHTAAVLQQNPSYDLPEPSKQARVELYDPELSKASLSSLAKQVIELVNKSGVQLSAQEWFVPIATTELITSRGFSGKYKTSRITLELVLYVGENERLIAPSFRRLSDLDLASIIKDTAGIVLDLPKAVKPRSSARARVALGYEEFAGSAFGTGLLTPICFHANAVARFQGLSRFEIGKPITEFAGDKLRVVSDPLYDYGTPSYPFDAVGLVPKPATLIKNGVFSETLADAKYATYAGVPPTGGLGTLVVSGGNKSGRQILRDCIYVESFSALDVNELTGDFFGEIRVGYAYDVHGARTPIKGGGVSGNIFEALRQCSLPKETVFSGNYFGPEFILFESLSVSA